MAAYILQLVQLAYDQESNDFSILSGELNALRKMNL